MKSFVFLLALLSLVFAKINLKTQNEDTHGCVIKEGQEECCWVNNNGCCAPVSPGTMCTMAITTCCKRKVLDETTGKYKYSYSHSYGRRGTDVM